jgi:hypothetical protein
MYLGLGKVLHRVVNARLEQVQFDQQQLVVELFHLAQQTLEQLDRCLELLK